MNENRKEYLRRVAGIQIDEFGEYLIRLISLYEDPLLDEKLVKPIEEVLDEKYLFIVQNYEIVQEEFQMTRTIEKLEYNPNKYWGVFL